MSRALEEALEVVSGLTQKPQAVEPELEADEDIAIRVSPAGRIAYRCGTMRVRSSP